MGAGRWRRGRKGGRDGHFKENDGIIITKNRESRPGRSMQEGGKGQWIQERETRIRKKKS